jgi:hypothetical protein
MTRRANRRPSRHTGPALTAGGQGAIIALIAAACAIVAFLPEILR